MSAAHHVWRHLNEACEGDVQQVTLSTSVLSWYLHITLPKAMGKAQAKTCKTGKTDTQAWTIRQA